MMKQKKRIMASILSALLVAVTVLTGVTAVGKTTVSAGTLAVTGLTALEITENMGYGVNIGNTLEATGTGSWYNTTGNAICNQETSWGNPAITEELFKGIKADGFDCVRIPITWRNYVSSDGNYTIDATWMAHIKEVVDWALDAGLYVIINSHHDWWSEETEMLGNYETMATAITCLWDQIADEFASYDQRLVFEGMNEPTTFDASLVSDDNDGRIWTGNDDLYEVVNYLNQVFVTTVRSNDKSGTNYNSERLLMVQGYAASSSETNLRAINIPTYNGEADVCLAVSAHSYDPYAFGIAGTQTTFDASSTADTGTIDAMFTTAKELFIDNGIAFILGETSATYNDNNDERIKWATYMSTKCASYGVPMILWDNGVSADNAGKECHPWVNRTTGASVFTAVTDAIFDAKSNTTWGSATTYKTSKYISDKLTEVIWSNVSGTAINWDPPYVSFTPEDSLFYSGRSIAVVYKGDNVPQFEMSSQSYAQEYIDTNGTNDGNPYWWMTFTATESGTAGDYKIAYFDVEKLSEFLATQGGCTTDALSSISLACTGATIYEIDSVGSTMLTYKSNGITYALSASVITTTPTNAGMIFDGWYSTINYQGDKFTDLKQATELNQIVYAKWVSNIIDASKFACILSSEKYVYSGSEKCPTVTIMDTTGKTIKPVYYTVDYTNNINAGTATATVSFKGIYTGTITKTFTITKATQPATVKAKAASLTVGETTSVVVSGKMESPTVTYSSSNTNVATVSSTGTITAMNVGTATITAKFAATTNYNTKTVTFKITVNAISASAYKATLSTTTATYTGKAIKPTVTVKDTAGKTIASSNYTVTYANNKNIGKATVAVTFKGNYTGKITKTFNILPTAVKVKSLTNTAKGITIKWAKSSQATGYILYRSKGNGAFSQIAKITKASTVSYTDTATLTNGAKYTYKLVVYKTVSGTDYKSDYGTAGVTYRLTQGKLSSLKSTASGKMTVRWTKNTKSTGYELRYVLGSATKTIKITKAATVSKVIKSLKAGKTYKVSIRPYKTVGSTTYYGAWSTAKSVKIKK